MSKVNKSYPFYELGSRLKALREKHQESLSEVSGAVEIEPENLQAIEQGIERPVEDILLLLISHFGTKEDVATELWQLAGYDSDALPTHHAKNDSNGNVSHGVIVMPIDTRIAYTDMVHVTVNNYGVVMNFMQTTGIPGAQPLAVSRLGMSHEHARSVIKVLQDTLDSHEPKHLPSDTSPKRHRKND